MTDGLAKGDCKHERSEYNQIETGHEWRVCLDCGEWLYRYVEHNGG